MAVDVRIGGQNQTPSAGNNGAAGRYIFLTVPTQQATALLHYQEDDPDDEA